MQSEKTAINESLLQSYRSNMIASQSFLLAVAAAFYEKNDILEMACVFMALFQLWYIWFRVIRVRAIIVDYYKHHLGENYNNAGEKENNASRPLEEKVYLKEHNI